MSRRSASAILFAAYAAAAHGQFPLGPGPNGPNPVVDSGINEYICRSVVEHAISSNLNPIRNTQVELVSTRYQGELVFVFSRVHWTTKHFWSRTPKAHVAEVQYSMVQRRFKHAVYDLWCCNTQPTIYQYYDLGRIRTKINDELDRFDKIAGDGVFPAPYPRGPSTMVPQIQTTSATTPPSSTGQPVKLLDEPVIPPMPMGTTPPPQRNVPPAPMPQSSTGVPPRVPPAPLK